MADPGQENGSALAELDAAGPGASEPSRRTQEAYLATLLGLIVVTAYFSVTFFHPDEQYQIIEFVGHKLGTTTLAELPWEFHERIRAWLEPSFYYGLARAVALLGTRDPFVLAFVFRLASGLLGWTAVRAIVRTSLGWGNDRAIRLVQLRVTTLLGFLPYLAVRTSSESLSGSLVTLAFCAVVDSLREAGSARAPLSSRAALIAGALFGLAFECRFQTALVAAGMLGWLVFFRRIRPAGILALSAGGGFALGLGLLADRWGYGVWTFPALRYFEKNVLEGVASAQFGSDPFYGYLYRLPANIFAPVVVVLMASVLLAWLRRPKHPFTWATFPYALAHCALAHKEERFFFPILLLATSSLTLGLAPSRRASPLPDALAWLASRADAIAATLWRLRRSLVARFVVLDNVAGLLVLAIYPLGWPSNLAFYEYVDRHVEPDARIGKVGDWAFPDYPFYRRFPWRPEMWPGDTKVILTPGQPTYLVTPLPYAAVSPGSLGVTPKLVYSEFPGWGYAPVRVIAGPALAFARRLLDPIALVPRAKWLTLYRLDPPSPAAP